MSSRRGERVCYGPIERGRECKVLGASVSTRMWFLSTELVYVFLELQTMFPVLDNELWMQISRIKGRDELWIEKFLNLRIGCDGTIGR